MRIPFEIEIKSISSTSFDDESLSSNTNGGENENHESTEDENDCVVSTGDENDIFASILNLNLSSQESKIKCLSDSKGKVLRKKAADTMIRTDAEGEADTDTQIIKQKSMNSIDEKTLFEYRMRQSSAKFNHASSAEESFLNSPHELRNEIIRLKMEMAQLQADLDTQESLTLKTHRESSEVRSRLSETIEERDYYKVQCEELMTENNLLRGKQPGKFGMLKQISVENIGKCFSTRSNEVRAISHSKDMRMFRRMSA